MRVKKDERGPVRYLIKKWQSKVGLAGYDILFTYFIVEAKKIMIKKFSQFEKYYNGIVFVLQNVNKKNKIQYIIILKNKKKYIRH